jgi:RHS repeat-associated protein
MRDGRRWAKDFTCAVFVLVLGVSGPARAERTGNVAVGNSSLSGASSSLGGALVIAGSPMQSEQARAAQAARWASPEARIAREKSRTEFAGLSAGAATRLASEVFPGVVDRLAGGPPPLPAGQKIVAYPTDNAAAVDLGGGRHGVIESTQPLAVQTSRGHREPIDLNLDQTGGAFQPARSGVGVRIPKHLADGVQLTGTGISLTPVDGSGAPLDGSEGTVDGTSVLYANTQTNTDSLIKPTTLGFEADTMLRSADSPGQLFFRVGLPAGARLVQAKGGSGAVSVVASGHTLATVLAPSARDAAGTQVPVSMSVSGDTLMLSVADHSAEYQYPIVVDPTVTDTQLWHGEEEGPGAPHWAFATAGPGAYTPREEYYNEYKKDTLEDFGAGQVRGYGLWAYATQGESHIYEFVAETSGTGESVENEVGIVNPSKTKEASALYPASYGKTKTEFCIEAGCAPGSVTSTNEGNVAYFEQIGEGNGTKSFTSNLWTGAVSIVQEKGPSSVTFNEASPTTKYGEQNILYTHGWFGPHSGGGFEATAIDAGIGINRYATSSPNSSGWGSEGYSKNGPCVECEEGTVANPFHLVYSWFVGIGHSPLPDGEDTVELKVTDPVGYSAKAVPVKIKVDQTSPYNVSLAGLPPNKEIGDGVYHLKASATDGSGSTPSSGVASLELLIDGQKFGSSSGSCTAPTGPCTATGEWTVTGTEFATGRHEIRVIAKDNAGNGAEAKFTMFVGRPTSPIAVGPGSVNQESGEFDLSSMDVSVGAPGAELTVARSYGSLHTTAGTEGPLGPQWLLSIGGSESVTKLPNGAMVLTDGTGLEAVFSSAGGGAFTSPKGDETLVLSERKTGEKVEFTLKGSNGSVTTFTQASSGASTWWPTSREEVNGLNTITTTYQVAGAITEPTEVLAPKPAGVSCSPELVKGCRALQFVYASETTATGNSQSEWGNYVGRLQEVTFTAWEPTAGKMTTTAVADYTYDGEGRLRAEWDPAITPALKTTYGYDSAGHVTSVSQPGQQPSLLTYGTAVGDERNGRLLAVTVPSASTAFGDGIAPVNTAAPGLSTTKPIYGQTLNVSTGSWSNNPLSYSYQWCNEGTPILGATNQTFPVPHSIPGYAHIGKLSVIVTATNATGSSSIQTGSTSPPTATAAYELKREFAKEGTGTGALKKPTGVAIDKEGHVWVADTGNNRIEKFTATGSYMAVYGKEGTGALQFKEPKGIAIDKKGYVFVADSGNRRIEVLNPYGEYVGEETLPGAPSGIAIGEAYYDGEKIDALYVALPSSNRIEAYSVIPSEDHFYERQRFGTAGSGNGQFSSPTGIALNEAALDGESGGLAYVTDTGNYRVQVLKIKIGTEALLEYSTQFGAKGSGNGQFSSPGPIAVEPEGLEALSNNNPFATPLSKDIIIADPGDSRFQQFSEAYAYQQQYSEKEVQGIAVDRVSGENAGNIFVANAGKSDIAEWIPGLLTPVGLPEPPTPGTSAVTTIEYGVPVSGAGAPYSMGAKEVEAWGQKDDPTEATAIFPPDEPEGWPAQNYKRASVYYLDAKGHTVNTASPSGAISTTEYNADNEAERTLSPDNRAAALKEGSKSAEVSKELDTENTYNAEGTELQKTLGPQHTVKLAGGSQVKARSDSQYFYNEGAPSEGGPYLLVTKTIDSALVSGKEEEPRETTMSYSGQENLGWKLRKPTSVTTDPKGLKLTHTTVYEPSTGAVQETKLPKGSSGGGSGTWGYSSQIGAGDFAYPAGAAIDAHGNVWATNAYGNQILEFSSSGTHLGTYGKEGAAAGDVKEPGGIAVNQSTGNVYVGDYGNSRVDEWNEKGEFVRAFGWHVNGKEELQVCTTTCEAGKAGSGAGQFKESANVAVDSSGNVWVTDSGSDRVQEFTEKGEFIKTFGFGVNEKGTEKLETCTSKCQAGKVGSGNGQFFKPTGIEVTGGDVYVVDSENDRVQELTTAGVYVTKFGAKGSGEVQFSAPGGMAIDSSGNLYIADTGNNRIEEVASNGAYITQFGKAGTGNSEFKEPEGVAVTSSGEAYVADSANNRVQKWVESAGGSGAHDTKVIYYSAGTEASVVACQKHPEWANLPCETKPVEQPGTSGLPELPVATTTYNVWDEPETTTETVGSSTRTKTETYEAGGRLKTSTTSSTVGTALPTITYEYSSESGALIKQCANEGKPCTEGKPKTITSAYNSLGQLTSYTDADENTATYEYDIDGRVKKDNSGKGTEALTYNETTGFLTELLSEYSTTKLAFTATYDAEGNMLKEGYPNGMNAEYTYNQTGTPTGLEYIKTTHCTEKCTWFSDAVVPSIHGQWLEQTSTLSHQAYTYDADGRLTQVQNTPAGKGCTTHVYAYDEDTNRLSLATHEPGSLGECTSTGGTEEKHSYDEADRLTGTGVKYSEFGNITSLPAADAGGTELTSAFYTDNQLASETQNGETIGYNVDPDGRTRETVSTGKTTADVIDHYAGGGSAPAWTVETPSGNWTRDIQGIGGLAAIQVNGATPVLQLADLHGDIIATAALSETETKLLSTTDASEFGVPTTSTPAKYSWLGAEQQPTELASGEIDMGARSYIPQLGRFLQPDPIPGGSANAYTYTFGDPVNSSDPSGESSLPSWFLEFAATNAQQVAEAAAAREAAIKRAAEEAIRRSEEARMAVAGSPYGGGGEAGPLGGYEGWACEYAAETGQEAAGCGGSGGGDAVTYSEKGTSKKKLPSKLHSCPVGYGWDQLWERCEKAGAPDRKTSTREAIIELLGGLENPYHGESAKEAAADERSDEE